MNRVINRLSLLLMTLGLLSLGGGKLAAVDNLQINVTLTIAASISVVWCDNLGDNDATGAQAWAIGNASLSSVYDTDTGDGTNWANGAGDDTGVPTYAYIQNLSNSSIDIDIACADSTPSGWSRAGVGANAFLMEVSVDNGTTWPDLTGAGVANAITNVLNDAVTTNPILLRLSTPSSITIGGGIAQTITVTATASVAN